MGDRFTPLELQTPRGNLVRGVFDDAQKTLKGVELVNGLSGQVYRPENLPDTNVMPQVVHALEDAMRAQSVRTDALEEIKALGQTIQSYSKYGMNPGVEPYVKLQTSYEHLASDMELRTQTLIDQALFAVDRIAERNEPTLDTVSSGLENLARQRHKPGREI